MCKNICRVFVCSAKNNHHPFLFVAFYTNMLYWVKSFVFVVLSFGKGGGEMRFLMLFLRLVLCAVCLFALCPSVPHADGAIRRTAFPSLPRSAYRSRTAACWPLPAPLSARPRGAACRRSAQRVRQPPWASAALWRALCTAGTPAGPVAATGPACFLNGAEAMRRLAPAFKTEHPARRRLAPKRGRPGDTLSFKGVYLSCSGSMRRLPYRSYPFLSRRISTTG